MTSKVPLVPTLGYVCTGLSSTGLILAAIQPQGLIQRLFSQRWLIQIGIVSYGLYIIHGYSMGAFSHHLPSFQRHHLGWLMPIIAFGLVYAAALLSYRFLELPFLRLKDRFAPTERMLRATDPTHSGNPSLWTEPRPASDSP